MKKLYRQRAFTLIELMLTLVIISILASVSYGAYQSFVEKAKIGAPIADTARIEVLIEREITNSVGCITSQSEWA